MSIQKILSGEIGIISKDELNFALTGVVDEMRMKGREIETFGEYLDLLANYIDFYRRNLKEELN